jgi:putative spermidine/putrescine transport system substrate-binding protein
MGRKRLLALASAIMLAAVGCDSATTSPSAAPTTGTPAPSQASPAPSAGGELVINSFGGAWGQAIQLGLIDAFQKETGIKVTLLSTWDIGKSKAAIDSGNAPPEDILDTDLSVGFTLDRDAYLAPIDYSVADPTVLAKIPEFAKASYGIGWGQFGIGICYDKKSFPDGGAQPANWADFWDFQKFPGDRSMVDWAQAGDPMPEFGLLADGVATSALYPIDLDRALAALDELKPHVPKFPSSPALQGQQLVDHQVSMAACYTHRIQKLIDGGVSTIGISFDQARLETEAFVVWENAPNKANAMKFLAYILGAGPQAAWAQIGNTSPINPDAFTLIPTDLQDKLATAPSHTTVFTKDDAWYTQPSAKDPSKTNLEEVLSRWQAFLGG